MPSSVFVRMNTNCTWAEIRLLNGIKGLRLMNAIQQPGVTFNCYDYLLQCQGNDRQNDVWAWFEVQFTDGGLPKVGVQCGSWNGTIASFRWPNQNDDFFTCQAGPGNIFNQQPYQECQIYVTNTALHLDELAKTGRPVRGKPCKKEAEEQPQP